MRKTKRDTVRLSLGLCVLIGVAGMAGAFGAERSTERQQAPVGALLAKFAGAVTDKTPGWTFTPSRANDKGLVYVASEGWYPDRGGTLKSAKFSLDKQGTRKGAWYKLSFDAKANMPCYVGVNFYRADGTPFIADNNDMIFVGPRRRYEHYFYASDEATDADVFFVAKAGIEAWDVRVEQATAAEAAAACDRIYDQMPPLDRFLPSAKASDGLPKTAAALREGRPWRVVLLGDSIVNDTFNSNFQSLVARAFPHNRFEYVASVRGNTGVGFYREPAHFKTFVADLKPDLLIIGGVSNAGTGGVAEMREHFRQVVAQARTLGCEILIMTSGNAFETRPRDPLNPEAPVPPTPWDPENDRLHARDIRAVAAELGVPLLDQTTAAYSYVHASGKPWGYFARDNVHSNVYGKQINGRILAAFLME